MLILIIIISTVVAILLLFGGVFIYIKQKNFKPKSKYDYDEHKKKTFLQRLLQLLPYQKHSPTLSQEIIPNDQSLTGLMDDFSSSTMGPGKSPTKKLLKYSHFFPKSSSAIAHAANTRSSNHSRAVDRHRSLRKCSSWQMA